MTGGIRTLFGGKLPPNFGTSPPRSFVQTKLLGGKFRSWGGEFPPKKCPDILRNWPKKKWSRFNMAIVCGACDMAISP